jgi:hypothetical protein
VPPVIIINLLRQPGAYALRQPSCRQMPQATRSPLACSSSSPRQRRMTGARRDQRAGSTTAISDSYSPPSTPTIQAPRPCLCLLHECCKARHLTGGDSALHAFTQLQSHITSLTSCTETRCKSADDHSPIVRFRGCARALAVRPRDARSRDVCRYRQQEWSLALPDMSRG